MVAVPARGFAASASPQCSVAAEPTSAPAFSSTPLGVLAAAKNIAFGIQASPADNPAFGQGMYDPVYQQIVSQESPQFIAFGSSFKFGNICPDPPTSSGALVFTDKANGSTNTWQAAQDLTNATQPKNVHARADALIWNVAANAPSWLQTLPDTTTTSAAYKSNLIWVAKYMSAAMKEITQLSNGHADFFYGVGLINEPIVPNFASPQSPSPAYYRDGPWFPTGRQVASFAGVPDYIASAFTSAQSYRSYWATQLNLPATTARFYINETLTETDQFGPVVRPALITLLKAMQAAKLNIQGVGLECHLQPQMMNDAYHPGLDGLRHASSRRSRALGLEVYITELDVYRLRDLLLRPAPARPQRQRLPHRHLLRHVPDQGALVPQRQGADAVGPFRPLQLLSLPGRLDARRLQHHRAPEARQHQLAELPDPAGQRDRHRLPAPGFLRRHDDAQARPRQDRRCAIRRAVAVSLFAGIGPLSISRLLKKGLAGL